MADGAKASDGWYGYLCSVAPPIRGFMPRPGLTVLATWPLPLPVGRSVPLLSCPSFYQLTQPLLSCYECKKDGYTA